MMDGDSPVPGSPAEPAGGEPASDPGEQPTAVGAGFGTFTGVFTPTLLTILGVIMYVRMGWVVGNAGLVGALLILGLAFVITAATGLSLSSIATNTRIGHGGPYAIMNKSLGFEVGGAIGIPLYLTRPLGVAMYIFGFREGLLWFYDFNPLVVDLSIFALLFALAYKGADVAFRAQYVIMAVIAASLVSIFASPATFGPAAGPIEWWGDYPGEAPLFEGTTFWAVFAVYFPATTGILAGANMSGDLEDPRRAIPVGTLAAIALSALIYVAIAIWCARTASLEELAGNYNHIIDTAAVPFLVVAGLLGATASSALAGLVGGPRILMAMGQNRIIPYGEALSRVSSGEPRNAIVVTGVLTLACIMMRDLNAIAPLVTMFFLITYCTINLVVLVEGSLGLVSYRPTLKVPLVVPLVGLAGCVFSMFIVNPTFSLVSVVTVFGVYLVLRQRNLGGTEGREDVRSSIFVAFAEWAASKVTDEDLENVRAWKPHVLMPVEDAEELRGSYRLLLDIARPEGTVKLLGIGTWHPVDALEPRLAEVGRSMRDEHVLTTWPMVGLDDFTTAVKVGTMALQGAFFKPNLLFLRLPSEATRRAEAIEVIEAGLATHVGVVLFALHPSAGLGQMQHITLWVRRGQDGWNPHAAFDSGNLNLILLLGYRLYRLWGGRLRLLTQCAEGEQRDAEAFLEALSDLARLPDEVERLAVVGSDFEATVQRMSGEDLSIFGLQRDAPDLDWVDTMVDASRGSCVFVLDSGRESARA